ncbi:hypothetical protein [Prescottella sp. R16]|uniref:hypothetical protein n=1 Tax=Prescottella sp. R16 TaxID=3064529 RepID=UPI00272E01CE|nr:hypothetical protein [Prescottella sp. R16]
MRESLGIAVDAASVHAVLLDTDAPELGPIDRRSDTLWREPGFDPVFEAATTMLRRAQRIGLGPRVTGVVSSDAKIAAALGDAFQPHGTGIVTLVSVTDARIGYLQSMPELQDSRTAIVFATEADDIVALTVDLATRGVHHAVRYPANYIGSDAIESILDELLRRLPWGRRSVVTLGIGAALRARIAHLAGERRIDTHTPFDARWTLPIGAAIVAAERAVVHVELPGTARVGRARHRSPNGLGSLLRRAGGHRSAGQVFRA